RIGLRHRPASQKRINADRLSHLWPHENPPDSIGAEHALAPLKTAEPIDEHMQKALQSDERPWHLRALVATAMASFGSRRTQQLYHCRAVLHSNPERFSVRPRESGDPEAADWDPGFPLAGECREERSGTNTN